LKANSYTDIEKIGKGGFGIIFKVTTPEKYIRAIKV